MSRGVIDLDGTRYHGSYRLDNGFVVIEVDKVEELELVEKVKKGWFGLDSFDREWEWVEQKDFHKKIIFPANRIKIITVD